MGLYIQESANLYAGDDAADNSKDKNLESIQLPTLEEMVSDHHAGGSFGALKIGMMGMNALEPTFKLKGHDPQVLSLFGKQELTPWTVYGLVRDKRTQRAIEVKAIIFGRLISVKPDGFERGKDILGHDYGLQEVTHYAMFWDGNEKIYWDFWESAFRVDGVDRLADERRILRIPGA